MISWSVAFKVKLHKSGSFQRWLVTNKTIALQSMESMLLSSKTLSSAKQSYSQTEKEALSPIYRLCKFHHYLYVRHFIIVTDHKPLHANVGPKKNILHWQHYVCSTGHSCSLLTITEWVLIYDHSWKCWWFVMVAGSSYRWFKTLWV